MRIAMISYHTCPLATLGGKDTGGMNVYVRDLSRSLGTRGVGVDVFTRSQDEHVPHVLHDLGFGNRVVHVPAGPESPVDKPELPQYLPEFVGSMLEFISDKGLHYDLIHSHYWLSGLAGLELRERWDVPLVHMFHTLGKMKNRVARSEGEQANQERLDSEVKLLTSADRIVAATEAEMAQFQWLYKQDTSRVVVIPPGVDTSRFYPIDKTEAKEFVGVGPEKKLLLFVGRIEPLKGIDTLLRAMAIMRERGHLDPLQHGLAIIGGDPDGSGKELSSEMTFLKDLESQLGLSDLVTFLGSRDQDTLQYYYSAAEVVVVPSEYESFGMVALEAMACGRPVVASETGGLAFLVKDGETGFHVPAGNPSALADQLEQLLLDIGLRRRVGKQASRYALGFDWEIISGEILQVYRSLLPAPLPA